MKVEGDIFKNTRRVEGLAEGREQAGRGEWRKKETYLILATIKDLKKIQESNWHKPGESKKTGISGILSKTQLH